MTTSTSELFQYINMTEEQKQLSQRYLQTKEEEILKDIQLTTIRDRKRSDFAERFINDFRKVHKQDPDFSIILPYTRGAIIKCSCSPFCACQFF